MPTSSKRVSRLHSKDPAAPLVPNRETIEAMKAVERGEVTTVGHPRKLLKSLKTMKTAPDDPFITQPERVAEIAQRAFGHAKDAALAENKRLGIKSYGTVTDPRADRPRRAKAKPSKPTAS